MSLRENGSGRAGGVEVPIPYSAGDPYLCRDSFLGASSGDSPDPRATDTISS